MDLTPHFDCHIGAYRVKASDRVNSNGIGEATCHSTQRYPLSTVSCCGLFPQLFPSLLHAKDNLVHSHASNPGPVGAHWEAHNPKYHRLSFSLGISAPCFPYHRAIPPYHHTSLVSSPAAKLPRLGLCPAPTHTLVRPHISHCTTAATGPRGRRHARLASRLEPTSSGTLREPLPGHPAGAFFSKSGPRRRPNFLDARLSRFD